MVNSENGIEKIRDSRVFTEDGRMETIFFAKIEKVRKFRVIIRYSYKELRENQNSLAIE